jgi:murein tripeptide amidase MpaA
VHIALVWPCSPSACLAFPTCLRRACCFDPSCRQLLLALAEWLCANYAVDAAARTVVTKTHLWLLPTMNPDGFAAGTRANA